MDFFSLRDPKKVRELYASIARGKLTVPEYSEWLAWADNDVDTLEAVLLEVERKLEVVNHPIAYPMEFVVVPRAPLSKRPLIPWRPLQWADPNDRRVLEIKELCGKLGKLINTAVIARGLVILDIDFDAPHIEGIADVKTRRGYHRVWFVEGADYVKIYGQAKYVFINGEEKLEYISGPNYVWSYPLQSRYLTKIGGKFAVKSYKVISDRLKHALASGDLTPITVNVEELREELSKVLESIGFSNYVKNLTLEAGRGRPQPASDLSSVSPRLSRFNQNPIFLLPSIPFHECLKLLSNKTGQLPVCLREALFGSPPKGTRYYHLRMLLATLPAICYVTEDDLEWLARDFAERTNSTFGETREWLYHVKYFTAKAEFGGRTIRFVSKIPFPREAISAFVGLGYCAVCPIKEVCRAKGRWGIVKYLASLLEV